MEKEGEGEIFERLLRWDATGAARSSLGRESEGR